jgi:Asp-tRNA(Asn)/Glu-tRNA(Gln) amidotransferase A subunit family amidase
VVSEAEARARIAARDGEVRAFVRMAPSAPARTGPLAGIPVAIKDIVDTEGLGTEYGSRIFAGHVPARDADCVARLKRAGAALLGKTATTEFAHVTPTVTRNPRDLARTPGGSSSGSAAAVADGMARLAIGTQTGGSVIRPASFCGVFGFKSSIGRTETTGVHELARSLDTVGWFARTAEDLRLAGTVLLRDARPPAPVSRPRLAFLNTPYDSRAEPSARAAVDSARAALAPHAEIVSVTLRDGYGALEALHRRIVSVEAARAFKRYYDDSRDMLSPALRAFVELGRANEAGYAAAQAEAAAARQVFDVEIAGFDAFVLPAALGEAPADLSTTGDAAYSLFLSLLGPPCASLPFAKGPAGMPIGVQFVAPRGRDEALLDLAVWAAAKLAI